jgi:hypothetical protein
MAISSRRKMVWRRGFDERYDFVALRLLRFTDDPVAPGEILDKSRVTPRKLRQLYDARYIGIAPDTDMAGYPSPVVSGAPVDAGTPPPPSPEPNLSMQSEPGTVTLEPPTLTADEYVPLPDDWRSLSAMDVRRLAEALTGEKINSRDVAVSKLEAYERARPA